MSVDTTGACFRCGESLHFCQCAEEYFERRKAFCDEHGREPTVAEMFVLQPQTEAERLYMANKASAAFAGQPPEPPAEPPDSEAVELDADRPASPML